MLFALKGAVWRRYLHPLHTLLANLSSCRVPRSCPGSLLPWCIKFSYTLLFGIDAIQRVCLASGLWEAASIKMKEIFRPRYDEFLAKMDPESRRLELEYVQQKTEEFERRSLEKVHCMRLHRKCLSLMSMKHAALNFQEEVIEQLKQSGLWDILEALSRSLIVNSIALIEKVSVFSWKSLKTRGLRERDLKTSGRREEVTEEMSTSNLELWLWSGKGSKDVRFLGKRKGWEERSETHGIELGMCCLKKSFTWFALEAYKHQSICSSRACYILHTGWSRFWLQLLWSSMILACIVSVCLQICMLCPLRQALYDKVQASASEYHGRTSTKCMHILFDSNALAQNLHLSHLHMSDGRGPWDGGHKEGSNFWRTPGTQKFPRSFLLKTPQKLCTSCFAFPSKLLFSILRFYVSRWQCGWMWFEPQNCSSSLVT